MKNRSIRICVSLSVIQLLFACASTQDKTENSSKKTTMIYFSSQAKPVVLEPIVVKPIEPIPIVQGIVYFDFDKYNIKPEYDKIVAQHARVLIDNPSIVAHVDGHTDVIGTNAYNTPLGMMRAKEVRDALLKFGVQERQLMPISFSFKEPVLLGRDAASRAMNRRVEISYQI
jgi:peptidoglycan-associated lipoprotein